jgi:hypothetical protein
MRRPFLSFAGAALVANACALEVDLTLEVPPEPLIPVGETCSPTQPETVRVRVEPSFLAVAPGQRRSVRVIVDPDLCKDDNGEPRPDSRQVSFSVPSVEPPSVAPVRAPSPRTVRYGQPTVDVEIVGQSVGATVITVSVPKGDGTDATATLPVDVLAPTTPSCSASDDGVPTKLVAGGSVKGKGALAGATISLPPGADAPNSGSFLWSVAPFDASVACAKGVAPDGYRALGPAVTFGPPGKVFARDVALEIPINPVLLPEKARWRHVRIAYSGPKFRQPRTIAVTDPRPVKKADGTWVVRFAVPRLGTFQAVVKENAGSVKRSRRISHRAVIGVSMGGAGSAQFGVRHHNLFDVIAPLGGPVDWTWLADHIEHNHVAGFRPIQPGTKLADIPLTRQKCQSASECKPDEACFGGKCTWFEPGDEPYEHASVFNSWWFEYPRTGTGGSFDRREYVQIFRDLALMFGNPNGYNPKALNLPAGVDPNHGSQTGGHANGECIVTIDPIKGDPNEQKQKELWNSCPADRCKFTQTFTNYFDDEFNPDGTFPVITFCDGAPQQQSLTPYANTWSDQGNGYPMEVALAVDYNGNGKRDELEPVIRAGHEQFDDWGVDAKASKDEPGYGPDNLDPNGDDYDPQFNPSGTEGDHRYQLGEPFRDFGLDGVANTKTSPFDFGEGDGKFTVAPGLQRMWDYDPHSMVRQWPSAVAAPLDDAALSRIDFWTDGGTRDLFNFAVAARHIAGTFAARGRDTVYFSDFNAPLGLDPATPNAYNPANVVYDDLQGVVFMRYGKDDPTAAEIENGSGQHVGTPNEITKRLQSALYFIGSRWPDAPRALAPVSKEDPAEGIDSCQLIGNCNFEFKASDGRKGPVAVSLPPGYAHKARQKERYPVIYMLHGYGMEPDDLQAAIVFLTNWMNSGNDSRYSRLPKAILVYVDGRCRSAPDGSGKQNAECMRGTFFTDSIRSDGPQMDRWWLELMDEIDKRYRTMGEATIEWPQ